MRLRLLLGSLLLALAGLCSYLALEDLRAFLASSGPLVTEAVFVALWWVLSATALMAAVHELSRRSG